MIKLISPNRLKPNNLRFANLKTMIKINKNILLQKLKVDLNTIQKLEEIK